jgi:hypothetical protein
MVAWRSGRGPRPSVEEAAHQRVFDEHGGLLDLRAEISLRPIWSDGLSHGRGGVFWRLLGSLTPIALRLDCLRPLRPIRHGGN